jgi:hypothetical protein
MYEVNSFVKWTGEDGGFSYVGQIKHFDGETYSIDTEYGIMGVPKDDGRIEQVSKPDWWQSDVITVTPVSDAKPKAPRKKSKRQRLKGGGPTKLDQVVHLLEGNPALLNNRKDAIVSIVEQLGMTPAGASTYYSNAKKRLTSA